jgi:2-amino-4-hydroxy-6-hydroxymethyldihydropteridine diphosphokinase
VTRAGIGLGANLGDREATLEAALARLCDGAETRLAARSALYQTEPWGDPDQPAFLNAAAVVETTLAPRALLARCLAVEAALGRRREGARRWGPRVVDLDILFYGDLTLETPELTLPHPRLLERAFALVPLAEAAPEQRVGGRRLADLAAAIDRGGVAPYPGDAARKRSISATP